MSEAAVSLESLLTPSKTVEFEYPGCEGFKLSLCYLGRSELVKIRSASMVNTYNKKTHKMEQELDEDLFLKTYVPSIIKHWSGLKFSYLEELLLVDVSEQDPDATLPYTKDNAITLMRNCEGFDQWISDMVGELENFTTAK